jgi:hypothetical protein
MLGDKGYGDRRSAAGHSDPIRQDLRDRGAVPEIPTKRNRHVQHSVSRPLYALRSRIERFINRLKNSRRVATRHDKTADSFPRLRRTRLHPTVDQVCPRGLALLWQNVSGSDGEAAAALRTSAAV